MKSVQESLLVTGARGPLPTALINWLKTTPYRVLRVTRNPQLGEFSWADLLEGNLLESVTVVIDFAWSTITSSSEQHPSIEWRVDLPRLSHLLTRVAERAVSAPRYIFISSGGTVYGNACMRPSQEDDELIPCGWHGVAKAAAENLIRRFGSLGVDFTILRPSNIYGFPIHSGPQRLIPYLLNAISEGRTFEIWGDGTALKDYLHVEDFIVAMGEVIQRKLLGVFNIAAGRSYSVSEVIRTAEEIIGKKATVTYRDAPKWDTKRSLLSCDKIMNHSPWRPTISLSQGIHAILEPSLEHAAKKIEKCPPDFNKCVPA